MKRSRSYVRALLGVLLVAGCLAAAIAPVLEPAGAAPGAAPKAIFTPSDIVISEFRFQGSGGEGDEFVELFNRSCSTVDLNGWTVRSSSGSSPTTPLYTFSGSVPLAAGQYYLLALDASPASSYNDSIAADQPQYHDGISSLLGGVALFKPGVTDPADAVGFDSGGYKEGTALQPLNRDLDQSYKRITVASGMYVDTNNNEADFTGPVASDPQDLASTKGTCGFPTVTIEGSAGQAGTVLSYIDVDGSTKSVTAGAGGSYSITVPANWRGTITPFKTGYTFNPPNKTYSPGQLGNQTNQNFASALTSGFNPEIMINEVAWFGTIGSSTADWIELYNPGSIDIDLLADHWILEAQDGIPSIVLTGIIPAHGFYLLANDGTGIAAHATTTPTAAPTPGCVVFKQSDNVKIDQLFTGDVSSGGETLFLLKGGPNGAVIDSANRNGGGWPAGSFTRSASMERSGVVPDSDIAWFTYADTTTTNFVHDCAGNRVYGTPGGKNWATTVSATPSPEPTKYKPPPPTPFAHMVINEFLPRAGSDWNQDGAVDVLDEFIEVKNLGPINVNLSNWKLDDEPNAGSSPFALPSVTLKPGDRAVFYGSTTHILLEDSGDMVRLINPQGIVIDARGYGPVLNPDESHCRLPDGLYWRFPCVPTPGLANAQNGSLPAPPPSTSSGQPPCLMADIVPAPFRDAECYGFGADIFNGKYWDDQSGFKEFPVPDAFDKGRSNVR